MSSPVGPDLKGTIEKMLCELDTYKKDRNEIMKDCIQKRLTKALKEYYNEINSAYLYLEYRNEQSLLSKYKRIL